MLDAVVIGSGLGGLTCAGLLARAGMSVAVLEQHYVAGGFAHGFRRGPYHFDSAIHYVGECGRDGLVTRILELLGAADRVRFNPLPEDGFDVLHLPDTTFRVPVGVDRYRERLAELFPAEARGIRRFVDTLDRIWRQLREYDAANTILQRAMVPLRHPALAAATFTTVDDALRRHVRDPRLRAVLVAQRADYGEAPARASLIIHAAVLMSFIRGGAYYPSGGSQAVADALVESIVTSGGTVRLSAPVESVLFQAGRACGVRLKDGEVLEARRVVSNADLWRTFTRLVPAEYLPRSLARKVRRFQPSLSSLSVFLGVDLDLTATPLGNANHWILSDDDGDSTAWRADTPADGRFPAPVLVSSPSLKDAQRFHSSSKGHTLQLFTMAPYDAFEAWRRRPHRRRGSDYKAVKRGAGERLIRLAETRLLPGLGAHVVVNDVGTPLTNEHYSDVTEGACYGPALVPRQVGLFGLGPATAIPGLWLAGSNGGSFFGLVGSMFGGLQTACAILARSPSRLLWGAASAGGGVPRRIAEVPSAPSVTARAELARPPVSSGSWTDGS